MNRIRYSENRLPAPDIRIEAINRGRAGEESACANWGSILVKVPAGDSGYSFEIVEGSSAAIVFPIGFIRPSVRSSSSGAGRCASRRYAARTAYRSGKSMYPLAVGGLAYEP